MPIDSLTVTGLFEGLTLSDLKARTLWKLKQKPSNYDRYSENSIKDALTDAQNEAVRLTRCLKGFAIIILKDGYAQYKAPSQLILPSRGFFYKSASSYYELKQKGRDWLDTHKRGWRLQDGDPLYMYPGDSYGTLRKLGFTPTPDTDGTDYAASPDTGVYASTTGMSTSGNISGLNNAASATVCTDSAGADMAASGVQVGMMAVNVTDGSSGQISAVSGATFTCTLTGGTNNTWAIGDSYTVLAGEYGVVTDWTNDEKYLFTADIGGMVAVETIVGNVYLEFVRRALPLQFDTQYPEVPAELHEHLPDGAVWRIKQNSPRGSNDFEEAQAAYQAFQSGIQGGYIDLDKISKDDTCMDFHL